MRPCARLVLLAALAVAGTPDVPRAQDSVVTTHSDAAPTKVAAPLNALLATGGPRVTIGAKTFDFWWVRALPLKSGSGQPAWSAVEEGTLVGAVRLSTAHHDIRGRTIKPGVYTLRYGIQPANGDHLGVSPYRDFLLLSPAAIDTAADPTGHDGTVDLSKKTLGTSHPASWSLDPPVAARNAPAVVTTELGHTAVVFEVPAARGGTEAGALRFGLVLVGVIEA